MSTPSAVLEQCVSYPLALALQDVLPVVLGAFGYWWLTRRVERDIPVAGAPMRAAVLLLVVTSLLAGPVRKTAAWLSDVAICAPDYDVPFSELQIPFVAVLAPGFAILSWGVLSTLRGHVVRFWPFLIPLVLAVVVAVAYDRRSALFGAGGLWAAFLAVLLVILAVRSRDRLSAALFVVYGIGTLVLPALAGRGTIADTAAQWEAQGVNTVTQAALAWGAFRLLRRTATDPAHPTETSSPTKGWPRRRRGHRRRLLRLARLLSLAGARGRRRRSLGMEDLARSEGVLVMKRTAIVLEWIVVGLMAAVSAIGTLFVTGYTVEDLGAARGWSIFAAFAVAIVVLSLIARFMPTIGAWVLGALCLLTVALPLWGVLSFDSYRAFLDSIGPVPGVSLLVLLTPLAVLGLAHPAIAGSLLTGTAAATYALFLATISGEPWLGLGATLTTSSTILITPMLVGGLALMVAAVLIHQEATHHAPPAVGAT